MAHFQGYKIFCHKLAVTPVYSDMNIKWLLLLLLCFASVSFAQERVSLDQFIQEAKSQNLSFQAKKLAAKGAKEAAYGIKLPPPSASLMQMRMDGGSANGFTVMQTVPFPTKITSEHSARKAEAKASKAAKEAKEQEVASEAKYLYFRLWESTERLKFLNEKSRIVAHHIKLAKAAARSDTLLKIHVIKVENDLDLLKNEILQAEQNARERQIEAAQFLNRDPNIYRPIASEFPVSPLPKEASLKAPFQLEATKFTLESLKSKERGAKSSWFPDFNFQYKEMGATPMMPRYSEVMIGATIPFAFFWQSKAEVGAATSKRLEGEILYENEKRQIEAERATLLERADSLKKQLDLFSSELLPRAEKRMKIVRNLAPRDMETLEDQRETLEALPDLKLKALSVRENYEKAVMELSKLKHQENSND